MPSTDRRRAAWSELTRSQGRCAGQLCSPRSPLFVFAVRGVLLPPPIFRVAPEKRYLCVERFSSCIFHDMPIPRTRFFGTCGPNTTLKFQIENLKIARGIADMLFSPFFVENT